MPLDLQSAFQRCAPLLRPRARRRGRYTCPSEAVWAEMSRLLPRLPPAYFALHLRMVGLTQTATDTEVSFLHTLADEEIPPLGRAHASVLEHAAHIDAVLTARCKNIDDSTVFGVGGTSVCYAPLGAASTQVGGCKYGGNAIVFLVAFWPL